MAAPTPSGGQNLWRELWRDEKAHVLNPEAFSRVAEDWAKKVSQDGTDERGNAKRNKTSQLRKFYDELFKLNQRARMQESAWEAVLPHVHLLIAKAAYAQGRDLVTQEFVTGWKTLLSQIKTREHLQGVASFFEAFMAFYKQYRPKD